MNLVDRYIFKQLLYNSLLILIFIISVFCLAKSVQLIELMISRNLPFLIFIKLIMNSIPQIIPILFPIIISLSVFFVYSRMSNDKELIVLQSSYFSNIDLIKPTFFYSSLIAIICSFFSIYQTPQSNKNFKILLYTIKNDYSSSLLQEGVFNSIGKDFTIFKQLPAWLGFPGPGEITILLYFFLKISLLLILSFLITSTFFLNFEI